MESYQSVCRSWVLQELTHSEIRIRIHMVYLGSISRREGKRDRGGKEATTACAAEPSVHCWVTLPSVSTHWLCWSVPGSANHTSVSTESTQAKRLAYLKTK